MIDTAEPLSDFVSKLVPTTSYLNIDFSAKCITFNIFRIQGKYYGAMLVEIVSLIVENEMDRDINVNNNLF